MPREPLDLAGLRDHQLRVLDLFTGLCRQHGLSYYAWGGTLLGAMKFDGYIPWDDDVDLCMPRRDYRRLLALGEDQLPPGLELLHAGRVRGFPLPYLKVGLAGTELVDHGSQITVPINIDVHPLDAIATSALARARFALMRFLVHLLSASMSELGAGWRRAGRVLARAIAPSHGARGRLARAIDRLAAHDGPGTDRLRVALWHNARPLRRAWFRGPGTVAFEGRCLPAPGDVRALLEALYGPRWTEMPPPERQRSHHTFEAFTLR